MSEDNPETGITTYGRDALGNLISMQVGGSGVTAYTYDGLNRMTLIDYPGATPDVTHTYDQNDNLKTVSNSNSQRTYTYDDNDNLVAEAIVIGGQPYTVGYNYNTLDHLSTIAYPTGREVSYSPDPFGRPRAVVPYVADISYHPSGQPSRIRYANGQTTDYAQNNRLWVSRINVYGTNPTVDIAYNYDVAGNATGITDAVDANYNLALGYDGLDRLTMANGIWGAGAITYDAMGNFVTKNIGNFDMSYSRRNNKITRVTGSSTFSYSYDDYGNVITNGYYDFAYDDTGALRVATLLASGKQSGTDLSTYFNYDGNNMRTMRTNNGVTLNYLYAKNGNLLAEYGDNAANDKEYAYLGSQMVASVKGFASPIANAGNDQSVAEGTTVMLDGSGSRDIYGASLNYNWVQTAGPTVTLSNSTSVTPSFSAPTAIYNAQLTFKLTVTNTRGDSGTDTVTVSVLMVDTDSDGLSDYWETLHYGDLSPVPTNDTDGDGYTALEEYQQGLDPNVAQQLQPVLGFIAKPGNGQNTIMWLPVDRASSYEIYWSTSPGVTPANGNLISSVTAPYVHTGLTNGQTYYYLVVAKNTCCEMVSLEQKIAAGMNGWSALYNVPSIGGAYRSDMAMNAHGDAVVVAANSNNKWLFITRYSNTNGWSLPEQITFPDGSDSYPDAHKIAINDNGDVVVIWWQRTPYQPGRLWARQYSPSAGWSDPVSIMGSSIPQTGSVPYVSLDNQGNILVIVNPAENDGGVLYAQHYQPATGWGTPVSLEDNPNAHVEETSWYSGFGIDANSAGEAIVAWKSWQSDGAIRSDYVKARRYSPVSGWSSVDVLESQTVPIGDSYLTTDILASINNTGFSAVIWGGVNTKSAVANKSSPWSILDVPEGAPENQPGNGYIMRQMALDDGGNISLTLEPFDEWIHVPFFTRYEPAKGWWSNLVKIDSYIGEGEEYLVSLSYLFPIILGEDDQPLIIDLARIQKQDGTYVIGTGVHTYDTRQPTGLGLRQADTIRSTDSRNLSHSMYILQSGSSANDEHMIISDFIQSGGSSFLAANYWRMPGAPKANASPTVITEGGQAITLDASASLDTDGTIVSYEWRQIVGSSLTLSGINTPQLTITPPVNTNSHSNEVYVFEMRVTDDQGLIGKDNVRVEIQGTNILPVADAGLDQTVFQNATVLLDGANSYDPNGYITTFNWQQTAGPAVVLQNADTTTPSFVAPSVSIDTVLTFTLTVTDDRGDTASDSVNITVTDNIPPTANAGVDQMVIEGDNAILDGSASIDTDGNLVSFGWVQTTGPAVTLTGADTATPTFVAPPATVDTLLTFILTVTDNRGATGNDSVNVTVQDISSVDTISPVTTATLVRSTNKGAAAYDVTLAVNEPATTYFRVTGDGTITSGGVNTVDWQTYTGVIHIDIAKQGTAYLEFYSVDTATNQEAVQTEVLQ